MCLSFLPGSPKTTPAASWLTPDVRSCPRSASSARVPSAGKEATASALIRHFGSIKALSRASLSGAKSASTYESVARTDPGEIFAQIH
jgi:hypothetical protein